MSPKAPDPQVRTALLDTAARLLTEEGPEALSTRRLAKEVGTSTMAVYTYFDGMEELRRELRREGFERLAGYLEVIERTDDTVADVTALGGAYFFNALSNSHLYRFMFIEPVDNEEDEIGLETFETLIEGVRRAIEAGRFSPGDPEEMATQLWVMSHGIVTLAMAGCLTLEEALVTCTTMATNLFVSFGDEPERIEASIQTGIARLVEAGLFEPPEQATA